MEILNLSNENFNKEIIESGVTAIVDFYADWCGPCKMQSPIIDKIAEEHSEIKVGKVNVDDNQELAEKYGIMSIPTILIIKNGEVTKQFVGLTTKDEILSCI